MSTSRDVGWLPVECPACGKRITLTLGGWLLRVHGPPARRCPASGQDPEQIRTRGGTP